MNTETENGMQMTLEEFVPMTYQKQTVGASDSLAKISQLPESNLDFKETVRACFSELCTLSDSSKKKINPLTFSLRTLRICLVLMEDGISPECSLKWNRGGYDAEWQVLNSKDFWVPQNRERCFIIGHLRGRSSAKVFPVERADGENRVQIIAHKDGYRRNTQVFDQNGITETLDTAQGGGRGHHVALPCFIDLAYQGKPVTTDVSRTILARYYKGCSNIHENSGIAIPVLTPDRAEKRQNGRRFKEDGEPMFTLTGQDRHGVGIEPLGVLRNVRSDYGKEIRKDYEAGNIEISKHKFLESEVRDDGVVNTLSTVQKDNQLAVKVAEATKQGYAERRVGHGTFGTSCNQGIFVKVSDELIVYAIWYEKYQCYIAIRRMTPKECFRLQGWTDDYFEKAQFVNSDSQLYKQAGNGVTVNVIQAIAEGMKINDAERIS